MSRKLLGVLTVMLLVLAAPTVAPAAPVAPKANQVVFKMLIPTAHVNTYVVQGTANDAAVPGVLPVHYKSTNMPGEGQTIMISGHHFSHHVPGTDGGVFLDLYKVQPGDSIYLSRTAGYGHGMIRFVVSSNRSVFCGYTKIGFDKCPPALRLLQNFAQTKVYIVTCEGDGFWRRIVTAYQAVTAPGVGQEALRRQT